MLGHSLGAILRQAAIELAAVLAILIATMTAAAGIIMTTAGTGFENALGSWLVVAVGGAGFLALSYLLTPLLVIGLVLPLALPVLKALGIDPTLSGVMVVLFGLAAVALRAARRDPDAAAMDLPPARAWIIGAAFVAPAIIAALAPELALAPAAALR